MVRSTSASRFTVLGSLLVVLVGACSSARETTDAPAVTPEQAAEGVDGTGDVVRAVRAAPHHRCFIDGNLYPAGAIDPAAPCLACDPNVDPHTWTARADGSPCGANATCTAGTCNTPPPAPSCIIGGTPHADGDSNPSNPCEICDPTQSTTAWTTLADGAACGQDKACFGGACTSHFPDCVIGGNSIAPGTPSPTNPCLLCQPRQSETAWTNAPDGMPCGDDSQCIAGHCESILP